LTAEIKSGEKIGIVGRTGAGKSSIMFALFRMMEPEEGSKIYIDGVDIIKVGIHTLRSRLSIIPQDPVLFSNTLRWNIDPQGSCSDEKLWSVIERANLKSCVKKLDNGLDTIVGVHGVSLSVGQRQLLCLARAMVRKSKIIVLDEATANVDLATDEFIQRSIMTDFKDCTILTIAHRIATVMDYDRIMVLSHGKIIEFDSPKKLLADDKSIFTTLMRETQRHN
jgi:ABC-type multidrug transport system fused ATPase/permease subunit